MSEATAAVPVTDGLPTPTAAVPAFTMLGGAGAACDGDSCSFEPFGGNDSVEA